MTSRIFVNDVVIVSLIDKYVEFFNIAVKQIPWYAPIPLWIIQDVVAHADISYVVLYNNVSTFVGWFDSYKLVLC